MASDFSYGTSNFDEPLPWSNRKEAIWGTVISFLVMSWLCALFRFYVRFRIVHSPGWDDLFLAGTVLAMTAGSISTCLSVHYGLGQHFLLIDPADTSSYLLTFYISNASYNLATSFIKLALLFQYLRIFPLSTSPGPRRAAQCLILFTTLWSAAYCFIAWFPCFPVRKIWLPDSPGLCYGYGAPEPRPFVATYISHGAINVALDVLTLVVPLPLLLRRTGKGGGGNGMSGSDRLRIGALFGMGVVVLAIAAYRLRTITSHQAATYPTRDPTWYAPITFILAAVEVDIAAICASIPIFYPVVAAAAATQQWGRIFITREVRITREDRFPDHHHRRHHHHHDSGGAGGTHHENDGMGSDRGTGISASGSGRRAKGMQEDTLEMRTATGTGGGPEPRATAMYLPSPPVTPSGLEREMERARASISSAASSSSPVHRMYRPGHHGLEEYERAFISDHGQNEKSREMGDVELGHYSARSPAKF